MSAPLIERALRKALPLPPPGWFDLAYSVTQDGGIGILRCDQDWFSDAAPRTELGDPARVSVRDGARGRLSRFDGVLESDFVETDLAYPFPAFDRLPGGDWVIANPRCAPGENNAAVISGSDSARRDFCLGDGIQHLQCDEQGTIWVGYFDEGIFGNFGWGSAGRPDPIGRHGLIRFGADGTPIWAFDSEALGLPFIDDCYALNAEGAETWACYYSDFPIVRLKADGSAREWDNAIRGASALAVEGSQVMLAGGYGEERDGVALLELSEREAKLLGSARLGLGPVPQGAPSLFGARANALHVVRDRIWYRLSVRDLREALTNEC